MILNQLRIYILIILLLVVAKTMAQSKFDYGVRATLNMSTIGSQYGKYNGSGHYSLGVFGSKKMTNIITIAVEPTYTVSGFKEKQNDNRYTLQHFDFNLNSYFSLLAMMH